MENKTLRFASMGTSSIMNTMQEAMRLTEGVECRVVCSRSVQKAAAYAEKAGIPESSGSFDETVKREDIDAVYIATPNYNHVELALKALSHGKHVIVEKPAAIDTAGIDAMAEAAKQNGVYFFEAITTIFMPNYLEMKRRLPELGKLTSVEISYGKYSSKYDSYLKGENPNIFNPLMKAGALNDMGVYCVHAAVDLFGIPEKVEYVPVYGPNDIDLEGEMYLTYGAPLDLKVRLETSKNRTIDSGCRIVGENGCFKQSGEVNAFPNCSMTVAGKEEPVAKQDGGNRMVYELAEFVKAICARDDAFFERMKAQSRAVSGILEAAHSTMRW